MSRPLLCSLLALLLLLPCLPREAGAAGFFMPGRGVKPLGRGGAFVASSGGDLNSLWYNPAGLAGLDALTLTIDAALVDLSFDFARAPRATQDNRGQVQFDPVSNDSAPKPNPQILMGGPLWAAQKLAWGFGLYAPYTNGVVFPEAGAQRYIMVDNSASILFFTQFSVAWQPFEALRVGASLQNVSAIFELVNVSSAYTGLYGDQEDRDLDTLSRATLTSMVNLTGNLGVWLQVMPGIEAGLSAQLPVSIKDEEGKLEIRLPENALFANSRVQGDTIEGGVDFPFMARFGLRLKRQKFDAEVAVVYENWSTLQGINVTPKDVAVTNVPGLGSIAVQPILFPLGYQDTYSLRLGGDAHLSELLTLRAGYIFETGAPPDAFYSVFLADADKHVFTLGTGLHLGSITLDASLAYYLMPQRVITTSQVKQINATDPGNRTTTVVGNGTYDQRYVIGGVAFTKTF